MKVIVVLAIILNFLYIFYSVIVEFGKLKKHNSNKPCTNLYDEKCSSYLWNRLIFRHYKYCIREKCPAFSYRENGKEISSFSLWSLIQIMLKQSTALATLVLLFLKLYE